MKVYVTKPVVRVLYIIGVLFPNLQIQPSTKHAHTQGGLRLNASQIEFFESLYRKYYKVMYEAALQIIKSPEIAEDIVADTFLVLMARVESVMQHEQPVRWLFRVLKNNALNEWRAQNHHATIPLDERLALTAAESTLPFSELLPKELSESERRILTLRLSDDLDYSEIAEILHTTESACRMQYSRARRHCAELIERQKNT